MLSPLTSPTPNFKENGWVLLYSSSKFLILPSLVASLKLFPLSSYSAHPGEQNSAGNASISISSSSEVKAHWMPYLEWTSSNSLQCNTTSGVEVIILTNKTINWQPMTHIGKKERKEERIRDKHRDKCKQIKLLWAKFPLRSRQPERGLVSAEEKFTVWTFKVAHKRNWIKDLGKLCLGFIWCNVKSVPATFCLFHLTCVGHSDILHTRFQIFWYWSVTKAFALYKRVNNCSQDCSNDAASFQFCL